MTNNPADTLKSCPWCDNPAKIKVTINDPDRVGYIMTVVEIDHKCDSGFVFSYGDNHYLWCTKVDEFNNDANNQLIEAVTRTAALTWNTRAPSEKTTGDSTEGNLERQPDDSGLGVVPASRPDGFDSHHPAPVTEEKASVPDDVREAAKMANATKSALDALSFICDQFRRRKDMFISPETACRQIDDVENQIRAALTNAQRPEVEVVMWQPIETAPMDGTVVLLSWKNAWKEYVFDNSRISDWCFEACSYATHGTHSISLHGQASYWMPLPEPPNGLRIVKEKV